MRYNKGIFCTQRYELYFHFCIYGALYMTIYMCLYVTHLISMARIHLESYMDHFGLLRRTWDVIFTEV